MAGVISIRPVRATVGSMMDRDRFADLWVVVWIVSLAVIPVYGWLVSRFRRSVFLPWTYAFVVASLIFVGISLQGDQPSLPYQFSILGRVFVFDWDVFVAQFFWVFMSVLNLFIISVFW